jgi:hypothetical protein
MKPGSLRLILVFFALLLLLPDYAFATHLRAGEITVRRDACNSLKFWITITVFTNTKDTQVLFGGDDDILDFGDGSDPDHDGRPGRLVPETQNTPRPDLGDGIATASFTIDHIYAAGFRYTISYSEPNRNEGVINMDGSVNTRFYIETQIVIDPLLGCNENTPVLAVPPIDRGCTGVAWFHNPGAYDLDGDSLSYEMVVPFRERGTQVVNYKSPIDPKFYPTNFDTGNEAGLDKPTFGINAIDGTITWDAPGTAGEYNIAFVIKEWRIVKGKWIQIGFVRRDMQIIIEDCENNRPDLIVPEDVCVEAGSTLDAAIFGTDPDGDDVKIEAFSEIFFLANAQSPATYSPNPATYQPSTPPAELTFQWNTECAHVKDQPYQVVFKITDSSQSGPDLVTFKTWLIRVVGPQPQFPEDDNEAISLNVADRSATLNWDKYFCQNAESLQIWRKVDSLAFEPDTCQTGMPENLGYELIDTVPITDTTYLDTNEGLGLNAGAVYCYRLVAIFPSPRGGESRVSKEVCLPPILADEPVITKVSILETGPDNGRIEVNWVPPFEADPLQYPPPYSYVIFRAEGFSGTSNLTRLDTITETSYIDAGLNTGAIVFNYRILAISANGNVMDTSAVASSVRLQAQSQLNKIELQWTASVPWSNEVSGLKHRIFRGDGEDLTTPDQLDLIAELDVVGTGFTYTDEGQHNSTPLEGGKFYCYVVETLGSYGNDDPILLEREPLRNFSQMMCTQPGDTTAPCKPIAPNVKIDSLTCQACDADVFENLVTWQAVSDECGDDIAGYRVYYTREQGGVYEFKAQVIEPFFLHSNLTSIAGCYKVSAIDRSGNESPLSDPFCVDNCPYYELPNVFTPNGDGCNELFSAYSNRESGGEGEQSRPCKTNPADKVKCARFVEDVTFKVYNRWGKEVYRYTTIGTVEDKTIYIDWDGRTKDGQELSSGIYYYIADVVFNTVDPSQQFVTKKGWIHLFR